MLLMLKKKRNHVHSVVVLIPDHNPKTNLQQVFSRWTYSGHALLPTKNGSGMWTTRGILNWHNSYTWNSSRIKECKCVLEIYISNSLHKIRRYSCWFSTCSACSNNLQICSGVAQVSAFTETTDVCKVFHGKSQLSDQLSSLETKLLCIAGYDVMLIHPCHCLSRLRG